jgi:stage IV sporulation protein FB
MGELSYYLIVLACAFFHELGHIITARLLGFKIRALEFLPVGLTAWIEIGNGRRFWQEILLYISCPLVNILIAVVFVPFLNQNPEFVNNLIYINIGLAVLNMVPILPLDGGKILNSFLAFYYSCLKAYNICIRVSECLIFVISVLSLIVVLYSFNITFIFVMIFIMGYIINNRYVFQSRALTELLDKKRIHAKKDIIKAKIIVVHDDMKLIDIIKEFSLGYFFLVVVLNEDMEIKRIISETEILELVFIKGVNNLLKDILN